jgi:hypothetical protein
MWLWASAPLALKLFKLYSTLSFKMFSKFKFHLQTGIRRLLTTLLRTIGRWTDSKYIELRRGTFMSVQGYQWLLSGIYGRDEDNGRMKSTKVTELHLYKMGGDYQHEYLVARIKTPDGATAYLSFERLRANPISPQSDEAQAYAARNSHSQQPSPSASPSPDKTLVHIGTNSDGQRPLPSSSSLDSFKLHHAWDRVRVQNRTRWQNDDVFLGKIMFKKDGPPLRLYKLVNLAVTVNESEPCWEPIYHNCHWFVGVVIQVLETCSQVKFEDAKLPKPKPGKQGEFPIYKPELGEDVETVIHAFKGNVKNFEEPVSSGIEMLAKIYPSISWRKDIHGMKTSKKTCPSARKSRPSARKSRASFRKSSASSRKKIPD